MNIRCTGPNGVGPCPRTRRRCRHERGVPAAAIERPPRPPRGLAHAGDQPFAYPLEREYVEPDWTRLPGYRDVTKEQWESAQWQRAHSVKNLTEFKQALGEHLTDELYADIERDQQERATMSMLLPPQMINTMDETDLYADAVRRYMAPALLRARDRVAQPPAVQPRLAARGRHVGGRGAHAPLPDEGARRADPDLPAVLRSLHPDGPRRQRHAAGPEVQVRDEAERPLGRDARLPARRPRRCATSSSAAATWPTCPPSVCRNGSSS